MKIKHVEFWNERIKLKKPVTIAFITIESVENIFVKIEAENGLYGLGTAVPHEEITGESTDDCVAALNDHLGSTLINQDLRYVGNLIKKIEKEMVSTPAARAAIDIAIHDLLGKMFQVPVADLLGRCHTAMATSVTLGIMDIEEAVASAKEFIAEGFKALKVKIGKSVDRDIEVLHKIREAVGSSIRIRTDSNQGYNANQYQTFFEATRSAGIELNEQPFKPDRTEEMLTLPTEIRQFSMADESLQSPLQALKLAASPRPFGGFNIKLMKSGGITPATKIAQIAEIAGIDLMWGCMGESAVSISAALHAAFASPATKYIDLDGSLALARDLVKGGFDLKDGIMSTTDSPGLGVNLL